jgi:hypothetical protein
MFFYHVSSIIKFQAKTYCKGFSVTAVMNLAASKSIAKPPGDLQVIIE